eukprot:3306760-Alexandrium_andersonii.AAC.1
MWEAARKSPKGAAAFAPPPSRLHLQQHPSSFREARGDRQDVSHDSVPRMPPSSRRRGLAAA